MIKIYSALPVLLLIANTSVALDTDTSTSPSPSLRRIYLLETALAPANPKAVATTWANAAKGRNGALQYMLMCPDLQKANLTNLDNLNWVTGVSSPWISSARVVAQTKKQNVWRFDIRYTFATGGGTAGDAVDHIDVVRVSSDAESSQRFCISQFSYLSPASALD